MLIAIAQALSCDVNELLGIEKEWQPPTQLDEVTQNFVLNAIKENLQFGICLRNFAKSSRELTSDDWKFLATTLDMAMRYAAEVLNLKLVSKKQA